MEKFILNSFINSTAKDCIIYNIISIEQTKKRVPKNEFSKVLKKNTITYYDADDYLIEYKLFTENVNNEKIPVGRFSYKSYLSDFKKKEQDFLKELIRAKIAVIESATTVVTAEVTVA